MAASGARAPRHLILDSGAVIALSRGDNRARAVLAAAFESDIDVGVPAVVVAETVRGRSADAPVNRAIKAAGDVVDADEDVARTAGELLGSTRSSSTIDAMVVASAIAAGGAVVLTGDADDLTALSINCPEVVIQPL